MSVHPQRVTNLSLLLLRALFACLSLFHLSFCCGWFVDEKFADKVMCHKQETVEEALVCCSDECSDWWAEQGLVHVFQSIL